MYKRQVLTGVDVNDPVLVQVQEVRDIISLALKLRNEKQVRIRQPLSTLYAVSYTHLDVYKRQVLPSDGRRTAQR